MRHILVVEDDEAIRETLKIALQGEGYLVFTAHNPVEGMQKLRAVRIDLVITDINMNGDGLELIKQMALQAAYCNIPVIPITATPKGLYTLPDYEILYKPFDLEHLYEVIQALLKQKRG